MCVFLLSFFLLCVFQFGLLLSFFSIQNHAFAIIINQHDGVNCIHYMVGYYFVLITYSFIRRELYIRFVLLLNP